MKRPIARRRITGARPMPRRRLPRNGHGPLRRPLALLYRQSGTTRPAASPALRAADGRAVPLAPRLQIALHLSLALTEQHHRHEGAAAAAGVNDAARAARAATAPPRLEAASLVPAGPGFGSPLSLARTAAPGKVGRHERFVSARSGFRESAPASRGERTQGARGRAAYAGIDRTPLVVARELVASARGDRHVTTISPSADGGGALRRTGEPPSPTLSLGRPSGAARIFATSVSPAAPPGRAAQLYLAERPGGASAGPGSSGPAWAPPPLDYRSAAPPPAPPRPPDARPATTTPPSAPPIDLEAVSRDVICRIEKRLRVERERRGRS